MWKKGRGPETESLVLPGRVSERDVGVFAEEAVGACVCAQCTVGRGFSEVGVGGCAQ